MNKKIATKTSSEEDIHKKLENIFENVKECESEENDENEKEEEKNVSESGQNTVRVYDPQNNTTHRIYVTKHDSLTIDLL